MTDIRPPSSASTPIPGTIPRRTPRIRPHPRSGRPTDPDPVSEARREAISQRPPCGRSSWSALDRRGPGSRHATGQVCHGVYESIPLLRSKVVVGRDVNQGEMRQSSAHESAFWSWCSIHWSMSVHRKRTCLPTRKPGGPSPRPPLVEGGYRHPEIVGELFDGGEPIVVFHALDDLLAPSQLTPITPLRPGSVWIDVQLAGAIGSGVVAGESAVLGLVRGVGEGIWEWFWE